MSLNKQENVLRLIEKEVDVSKLVQEYRKENAGRALIRKAIRLEYEKKSLEKLKMLDKRHEETFLKRLDRELEKAFSHEQEQAKKVKRVKQPSVSQKMVDRYWRSVEEIKLAHDASEAYERVLIAWKTCPSPYREKFLDLNFKVAQNGLEQIKKNFPDLFWRGQKQMQFKRKAMQHLFEKLIEAAHKMDRSDGSLSEVFG